MERFGLKQVGGGQFRIECPYRGLVLLRHAMYSKGSAFTREGRAVYDAVHAVGRSGAADHHAVAQ